MRNLKQDSLVRATPDYNMKDAPMFKAPDIILTQVIELAGGGGGF